MHCMLISTHLSNKTESEISISVDLYKFLILAKLFYIRIYKHVYASLYVDT